MATYAFETITAAQALAFSSGDDLTISSGSARNTSVLFLSDGTYSLMVSDRMVVFGSELRLATGSRVSFADSSQLFIGSAGADTKDFGAVTAGGAAYGGDGPDTLAAGPGAGWLMQGNQGNDQISARAQAANTVYGGQNDDAITFASSGAPGEGQFVQGNRGADTIHGADGGDTLLGGQGNDSVHGDRGSDFINGNLGDDQLSGGGRLFGEDGADTITADVYTANTISGGDGDDFVILSNIPGVATRNLVHGDGGNDRFSGLSDSADEIYGDQGDDFISFAQNSTPGTLNSSKLLDGGEGNDSIFSAAGADTIRGGGGADRIDGSGGADVLSGGAGADIFFLRDRPAGATLTTVDRILDWSSEDRIRLIGPVPNYVEAGAPDYAQGLQFAGQILADGRVDVAAIQIPDGVLIFTRAFEFGHVGPEVDAAALLVGRTLADISHSNFS